MSDLLNAVLDAYGGLDRWRQFNRVQATIVTGGGLWAIKGQPQDPRPRRMTVALDHEWASLTTVRRRRSEDRVHSRTYSDREARRPSRFRAAQPARIIRRARVRHAVGPAAARVLQWLCTVEIPHHAVSSGAGRCRRYGRSIPSRTTGRRGRACRRTFHPESQRTLPSKSSTSETTTSCVAMITGSTWREGFPPSITFTARSRPRASRFPDNAGRIAPMPTATPFPISSWSRSMSATSVSSRALGRAQSGNDVAKAEGEGCSSWA